MPSNSPEPRDDAKGSNSTMKQTLDLLGRIIAPTTVLSGLLYYFGWVYTYAYYGYFGIDHSILGFSTQDYLLRSIIPAFEPLRWLLILSLAFAWGHHLLVHWIGQSAKDKTGKDKKRLRLLVRYILGLGILFILAGPALILLRVNVRGFVYPLVWTGAILFTAYGAFLVLLVKKQAERPAWAADIPPGLRQLSVGIVIGLLIFSLFWFVSLYAKEVGIWQAQQTKTHLTNLPCVDLYSQVPLSLEVEGVETLQVSDQEGAYRFHYKGLRFFVHAADQLFLLSSGVGTDRVKAIILAERDEIRIEVAPGSSCP